MHTVFSDILFALNISIATAIDQHPRPRFLCPKRPIACQCGDVPINEHTLGAVNAALFPRVTSLWEAETGLENNMTCNGTRYAAPFQGIIF